MINFTTENLMQPVGSLVLKPNENDYILGAKDPKGFGSVVQEDGHWTPYLQNHVDIQKAIDGDTWGCTGFSDNTVDEIIYKKKYGTEMDLSDRYIVVGSGNVPGYGNSMQAPADFKRKNGFLFEAECPFPSTMTLTQFYAKITEYQYELGKSRLNTYDTGYLMANDTSQNGLLEALKVSPLKIAVEGRYIMDSNGWIYNTGNKYNHAVVLFDYRTEDNKLVEYHIRCSETKQYLKFRADYKFVCPMVKYLEKKSMFTLIKEVGIPMVYLYSSQLDKYWAIVDSDPLITTQGEVLKVAGGDILKAFCGNNYKNAIIQSVPVIDHVKIKGYFKLINN